MPEAKKARGKNAAEFNDTTRSGSNDNAAKPAQKTELLAAIKNALPAFGADRFTLGEEEIRATPNQKELMRLVKTKDVVFVNGPFGTGKTFWTCLAALQGLAEKKYNKISLTAPAVGADEDIGFLPGTKDDKMAEHVNQILETIEDLVGKQIAASLREAGLVEIAPHGFNRGRTYKKTFYILDESQNASARQLMTSLGRLGHGSTFVYMGDDKQNDRTTGRSAFVSFMDRFNRAAYAEEIGAITLGKEDVRRHPLLKKIVENGDDRSLDGFEDRGDSRPSRQLRPAKGNSDFPNLKP